MNIHREIASSLTVLHNTVNTLALNGDITDELAQFMGQGIEHISTLASKLIEPIKL